MGSVIHELMPNKIKLQEKTNVVLSTGSAWFPRDALTEITTKQLPFLTQGPVPIPGVSSACATDTYAKIHLQSQKLHYKNCVKKSKISKFHNTDESHTKLNSVQTSNLHNCETTLTPASNNTKNTLQLTIKFNEKPTTTDDLTATECDQPTERKLPQPLETKPQLLNKTTVTDKNSCQLEKNVKNVTYNIITNETNDTLQINTPNIKVIDYLPRTPPPSPQSYKCNILKNWPILVQNEWANTDYALIYSKVRETGVPNYLAAKIPLKSGLKIQNWKLLLSNYHDNDILEFLEFGWPVDYSANRLPVPTYKNHIEREDYSYHINKYIQTELKHKALLGPFKESPFKPWCQYSPVMTREKKHSQDRRIIVDLSYPKGNSVNSGIRKKYYLGKQLTYTLPGINDIINKLTDTKNKTYLWCIDLARAYRQLRTDPLSVPLLGIIVNNNKYFDIAPPFGCRSSSMACARTTNAVVHLLNDSGYFVLCYLDDFIGVESSYDKALEAYQACLKLLSFLGLDVSSKKCIKPTQNLIWLGYNIDSKRMIIKIPKDKLLEIIVECKLWTLDAEVTRKNIQHIAGKLNFISKCVTSSKTFMNRILLFLRQSPFKGKIKITNEVVQDLAWFINFAKQFNGLVLLPTISKHPYLIECDACLTGGGGYSESKYFAQKFNLDIINLNLNIAQLEAINLIAALENLCPQDPHNYDIQIVTDNMSSKQVLATGSGKDVILTACARKLWHFCALKSCHVEIIHKPGKTLIIADALSRAFINENCKLTATNYCIKNNLERILIDHNAVLTNVITCM